MRVLVIEDEDAVAEELRSAIAALTMPIEVVVAGTRAGAAEVLEDGEFDFIVCNLHLPSEEGDEPSLEHGFAVYEHVATTLPGTPTIFLTGRGDERAARERVAARTPADIFGVGETYPMADLLYKHESSAYVERIAEVTTQIEALNAIDVQPEPADLNLSEGQLRALRIFARRHHARRVEFRSLGGLSDSLALQATLFTADRTFVAAVFAKLGPLDEIADESARYHEAAVRLPAGSYAPLLDTVDAGAGRTGGLFYGLADRHPDTLFGRMLEQPEEGAQVVEDLRGVLEAWRDASAEPNRVLVTTLRRERIASNTFEPFARALGEGWQEFEKRSVPVAQALQHGDLHGANVLVGQSALPLLVDFANVGPLPAGFDPLVLELSLVFHPQSPFHDLSWPSVEQCEHWDDLGVYLEGCPTPNAVRVCRRWAMDAAGESTAYALAYAEALRQLQFASSETDRALAIARAACRRGMGLTEPPEPRGVG